MPEKPRRDHDEKNQEPDQEIKDSWANDQKKLEYYYDDAHGYETYNPECELDDDDQPMTVIIQSEKR